MKILNASSVPLSQATGGLPNVGGALLSWFRPMVFGVVVQAIESFEVAETITSVNFKGVWQPLSAEQLKIKPEGERSWDWYMVHSDPSLILQTQDKITYLGVIYKVMATKNYKEYGYNYYELIKDYQP